LTSGAEEFDEVINGGRFGMVVFNFSNDTELVRMGVV